jgi:hypothetical protein
MCKNNNLSEAEIAIILEKYNGIKRVLDDCYKIVDKTFIQQRWNGNNASCSEMERTNSMLSLDAEFYEKMINKCFRLYSEINQYVLNYKVSKVQEIQKLSFNKGVFAFDFVNDRFYAKLPRFVKRLKNKQGGMLFEKEFRAMITDFFKKLPECISFREKMIYIVNVYSNNTNPLFVPDNDNLDFKRAVDIITDFIGGGDSAFVCSYMITSICSDSIQEGAYIIVQDSEKLINNKQEIISLLQSDFQSNRLLSDMEKN